MNKRQFVRISIETCQRSVTLPIDRERDALGFEQGRGAYESCSVRGAQVLFPVMSCHQSSNSPRTKTSSTSFFFSSFHVIQLPSIDQTLIILVEPFYNMKVKGFSMYPLNAFNHLAAIAPSTVLWSADRVAFIIWATLKPFSLEASGSNRSTVPPIAKIHD
jgi:hypothetical protein